MKRARFPRQPLVGMALAAMSGIVFADFFTLPIVPLCLTIAFLALVCLVRPRGWLVSLLVGAGFLALHLVHRTDALGKELHARLGNQPRWVTLLGRVESEPKLTPNDYTTFFFRLQTIDLGNGPEPSSASVLARWKGYPQFGDQLRLRGLLEPVPPARNPGVFDFQTYLARRDIYQAVLVRDPGECTIVEIGGGNFLIRLANRTRNWMESTLARDLEDAPEATAMINGMALGIRHETPNDIEEPFQQTGTLHLFAVAGLHVGIIARLLWIFSSLVRLPRRAAAALIIPALFFYSAITGFHVSSVRAATMAAFLLGGIFFERPVLALNSLGGAAVAILAVDSNQLFTSGFQLSFAVVGAILLWQEPFFRALLRPSETDPFLPRSLVNRGRRVFQSGYRKMAGGISVSAAAWVGSLLFIIWYFYLITPISLLANLAVVPIAFCVLAVGLLSLLSAPFSGGLSVVFNNTNWCLAKVILGLVQLFSALPGGHLYVERPHWPNTARVEITVLDAGAGSALHLRDGNRDWFFDAGSARDYEHFLRDYLHARGINRLDGLLLSHGDSLHIGGALLLLEEFQPQRVIDNPAPDRSTVHRVLTARLAGREMATQGKLFALTRHVTGKILHPPADFRAKAADDQALVIQLRIEKKFRVLLVFDSGRATERLLLARPNELRSNILIKGQHYTGQSGSAQFLDAVRPELVVATSVDFPAHERVADDWAQMLREHGIQLLRQDRTGAVRLQFFRDHWRANGFLDQETFRSSSR